MQSNFENIISDILNREINFEYFESLYILTCIPILIILILIYIRWQKRNQLIFSSKNLQEVISDNKSIIKRNTKYILKILSISFLIIAISNPRILENNESIYVIPKSQIIHLGAKAVSDEFFNEVEYSRNWHWMWSTFYFNKKHHGYFFALKKTYKKLIRSIIKILFFTLTFNSMKKKIYLMRFSGLYNAIIGKKSWYRAKIE